MRTTRKYGNKRKLKLNLAKQKNKAEIKVSWVLSKLSKCIVDN